MQVTHDPFELVLEDHMASDLVVVNSARVSFEGKHNELTEADKKLLGYLGSHQHYSPFRHCMFRFRIRAPEFVMRQLFKHVVGIEGTSGHPTKDSAWNEICGRYRPYQEVYIPNVLYEQHASAEQCSGDLHVDSDKLTEKITQACELAFKSYHELLEKGVSREQARMILPLNIVTEVVWTASLQAIFNFVQLRDSENAQLEIRMLARAFDSKTRKVCPYAWDALTKKCSLKKREVCFRTQIERIHN